MSNIPIKIVLIMTVMLLLLSPCVRAETYSLTEEEQLSIISLIQNDPYYGKEFEERKETILTETVSHCFRFDPIEYGDSGRFSLSVIEGYYMADVVTETGAFAGIAHIQTEQNKLKTVFMNRSSETADPDMPGKHPMSCNFANYKTEVERHIGKEINVTSAPLVKITNSGNAFFIDFPEGESDYFVWLPFEEQKISADSIVRIDEDFYNLCKQQSEAYYAKLEQNRIDREEWEKNHPGATFPIYYGGTETDQISQTGKSNNILTTVLICVLAACIICGTLAIIWVSIRRKRK